MDSNKDYIETKCRRCGTLDEWEFNNQDWAGETYKHFLNGLISESVTRDCNPCGKKTVQDIVAFTTPRDNAR